MCLNPSPDPDFLVPLSYGPIVLYCVMFVRSAPSSPNLETCTLGLFHGSITLDRIARHAVNALVYKKLLMFLMKFNWCSMKQTPSLKVFGETSGRMPVIRYRHLSLGTQLPPFICQVALIAQCQTYAQRCDFPPYTTFRYSRYETELTQTSNQTILHV